MRPTVGHKLVEAQLISPRALAEAERACACGGAVLERLVTGGLVEESALRALVTASFRLPAVEPEALRHLPAEVLALVPAEVAREFRAIPLGLDEDGNLRIAMADPSDMRALEEIAFFAGRAAMREIAAPSAIASALALHYGPGRADDLPERPDTFAEGTSPSWLDDAGQLPRAEDGGADEIEIDVDLDDDDLQGHEVESAQVPRRRPQALVVEDSGELVTAAEAAALAAQGRIDAARTRDQVVDALLDFTVRIGRRGALFVAQGGDLRGWAGRGKGVAQDAVRGARLDSREPSILGYLAHTPTSYRGRIQHDVRSREVLIDALGSVPDEILAVSIPIRSRVIGVLYADEPAADVPARTLARLARGAGAALERTLQQQGEHHVDTAASDLATGATTDHRRRHGSGTATP